MSAGRIARNLEEVRQKVGRRCLQNKVDESTITIVGITKTFGADLANEGVKAGLRDLGENRVQESAGKIPLVAPRPVWHLVGHLQKNKAKKAVELFDIIQSVDSFELANLLSEQAGKIGKRMKIFLQVNSTGEPQKSGFEPAEILRFVDRMKTLPNLEIRGLMTIGPLSDDVGAIEKSFSATRALFETIRKTTDSGFDRLSMGMSGDYELALDYGANVLRIGTAIFGARKTDK